jgi:GPH family glycoside/pentoside/hexuronide:cation symporter
VATPSALPLPTRQLLAYGALGLPLAMAALPVYVHVPRLYAEAAGMSLSLLGALLLAARCSTPVLIHCSVAGATARRIVSA